MDALHAAREAALAVSRKIIQTSSKSIRNTHRQSFAEAESLLREAMEMVHTARANARPLPAIEYAGYLQDAEKEMVEAATLLAAVRNEPIPSYEELRVDATSYLHGLGEAASEGRRYVLDRMRRGEYAEAERVLIWMEDVYDDLITLDYPDGLTGGLRRTTDALRAVVERTRSDVTLSAMQSELLVELRKHDR